MDSGGGTGEQESEGEEEQILQEGVRVSVEFLPFRLDIVGTPPNHRALPIHTIRVQTPLTVIQIEQRGLSSDNPEQLLQIASELLRTARLRLRQGTLQVTQQEQ